VFFFMIPVLSLSLALRGDEKVDHARWRFIQGSSTTKEILDRTNEILGDCCYSLEVVCNRCGGIPP
jgi:hypothetical protein